MTGTEMRAAKRPRVLLADDFPGILTSTARLLSGEFDVVGYAADGKELVEALWRLRPDVVVLDLNLPKINSIDFCREVTRQHPYARVIVMTGMLDDSILDYALAAGAAAVLTKYELAERLIAAIHAACAVDPH